MAQNGTPKRTNPPTNGSSVSVNSDAKRLQDLSALVTRLTLAGNLGLSHGGDRDIYGTLGYPLNLESDDLITQWKRQDIARAIVDRPVKATWQGDVVVTEPEQEEETELEESFKRLNEEIDIKSKLMRADRLAQLGEFAVLLLGFDDSSKDTWTQPVEEGNRTLMYARPISKENAEIGTYETDPANPRFGKPRTYKIHIDAPQGVETDQTRSLSLDVHYTRIIHIAFDKLENEVEGEPVMKAAYNRLKDLEKLVGGSAEMFWRGARPGYHSSAKEDYKVDSDVEKDLREQIDEYEHNLRRFLVTEGMDMEALDQQISDPSNHFKIQLQALSALTGIPLRILLGSERGELASSQDKHAWNEFIQHRRTEEVEPEILIPFVDRMIKYGVLPEPKGEAGYSVVWSDLFKLGEKEKAEVGASMAEALAKYAKNGSSEQLVPLEAFLKYFLKMDEDTTKQILELSEAELEEMLREEAEIEEELAEGEEQLAEGEEQEPEPADN